MHALCDLRTAVDPFTLEGEEQNPVVTTRSSAMFVETSIVQQPGTSRVN
jgi:hypothetical protein